jgi:hypothetical protein
MGKKASAASKTGKPAKVNIITTPAVYSLMRGGNERSIRDILITSSSHEEVEECLIKHAIDAGKGNVIYDDDMDGLRDWRNEIGDQIIWQRGDTLCRVGNIYLRIGGVYTSKEETKSIVIFARGMLRRMGEKAAVDMIKTEGWRTWVSMEEVGCSNASLKEDGLDSCPVYIGEQTGSLRNKAVCLICNRKFEV